MVFSYLKLTLGVNPYIYWEFNFMREGSVVGICSPLVNFEVVDQRSSRGVCYQVVNHTFTLTFEACEIICWRVIIYPAIQNLEACSLAQINEFPAITVDFFVRIKSLRF